MRHAADHLCSFVEDEAFFGKVSEHDRVAGCSSTTLVYPAGVMHTKGGA
jgi:hypothetical protein